MGPLRRGARGCSAPFPAPSLTLSFFEAVFLDVGRDGTTAKLGSCVREGARRGCTEQGACLGRREEKEVVAGGEMANQESSSLPRGDGGCVLLWWEWDWAYALYSACAFPGLSFLFFPEKGQEMAMPGRGAGLPHFGAPPVAECWGRRGTQQPPGSWRLG